MSPKLHLIRHAEGYHNLGPGYWSFTNPLLTEKGKQQCLELGCSFPSKSRVELIVTSPLRRAIYTCLEDQPGRKLIALPSLQELKIFPCDVGSKISDLQAEVDQANLPVDLSFVKETWTDKTGKYEPAIQKIQDRARGTRHWFKARPEEEIVVVSHGGLLHFLTDDWEGACEYEATGWINVEYRTYEFVGQSEDAPMQETLGSRQRRGKPASQPINVSQKELCSQMIQGWASQGYPIGPVGENGVEGDDIGHRAHSDRSNTPE